MDLASFLTEACPSADDRLIIDFPHNSYWSDCSYFDYRIGCDICSNGTALGFTINSRELFRRGPFCANELVIRPKKWYKRFDVADYVICSDTATIQRAKTYFDKFENSHVASTGSWGVTRTGNMRHSKFSYSSSGLTGCFDRATSSLPKTIRLCSICFNWVSLVETQYIRVHPLSIFWYDLVKDLLKEGVPRDPALAKSVLFALRNHYIPG